MEMKVIGITGSLGMGKSTIARMLKMLSFPVFDADHEVKKLLFMESSIIDRVSSAFPGVVEEGRVRRGVLADIIYNDPEAPETLEQILHPEVRKACYAFIHDQRKAHSLLIFLDIPLLFEKGFDGICDSVWVAWCDPSIRQQRVMKRSGLSRERIEKISQNQLSDAKKKARADQVIDTSSTKVETFRKVVAALENMCFTKMDA